MWRRRRDGWTRGVWWRRTLANGQRRAEWVDVESEEKGREFKLLGGWESQSNHKPAGTSQHKQGQLLFVCRDSPAGVVSEPLPQRTMDIRLSMACPR